MEVSRTLRLVRFVGRTGFLGAIFLAVTPASWGAPSSFTIQGREASVLYRHLVGSDVTQGPGSKSIDLGRAGQINCKFSIEYLEVSCTISTPTTVRPACWVLKDEAAQKFKNNLGKPVSGGDWIVRSGPSVHLGLNAPEILTIMGNRARQDSFVTCDGFECRLFYRALFELGDGANNEQICEGI